MAKTLTEEAVTSSQTRKQRKKQAKQEAKIMLRLGQAKKDVQKAEQKVARAQSNLEASTASLHELEGKLSQLHTAEEPHNGTVASSAGTTAQSVEIIPQVASESSPQLEEEATQATVGAVDHPAVEHDSGHIEDEVSPGGEQGEGS